MSLSRKPIEIIEESKNPLLSKHESWGRVYVDEVANILNGYAFKSSKFTKDKGVPLIRIRDVGKNSSETFYDGEYEDTYLVNDGDLIIGMDGDFRCAIWKGGEALLNQRVCKISLKSNQYDFKFLSYVLQPYLNAIHAETSAVTVKHLSSKTIAEIPLPLPPHEQQKRIAAKIEELFTHIDAGIASLQAAKKLLKQYRQSVLKAAVTGELTKDWRKANKDKLEPASQLLERILKERRQHWEEQQLEKFEAKGKMPKDDKWKKKYQEPVKRAGDFEIPEEWVWATYSQLGEWIGGGTPSKAKKIYWTDGTIPWVSPKDMKSDYISDSEDRITEKAVNETVAKMIPKDSLLFVVRSGILRRILPVGLSKVDCSINQDLKALVPTNTKVSEFLLKNALALNQEIRNSCQRGGTTVESIEVSKLQVYSIPLPPLHEQYVIVNFVDEKFVAIERLENILDEQLLKAERKKLSILTSAFNGNL